MRAISRNGLRILPVILALPLILQCSNSVEPDASLGTRTYDYRQLSRQVSLLELGFSGGYSVGGQYGDAVAVAQAGKVFLVDTQDLYKPSIVQAMSWQAGVNGAGLTESNLFIVDHRGLHILNRNRPLESPVGELLLLNNEFPGRMLLDRYCFLGVRSEGKQFLYVISVEDPTKPVILSKLQFEETILDLAREGDLLVVGTQDGAVVLDISDPLQVESLSTLDGRGYVTLRDGIAYLTDSSRFSSRGLVIYDIRDPRNPIEMGRSLAPNGGGKMTVRGDRLYARISGRVEVLDISDLQNPVPEISLASPGNGWLFVRENQVCSVGHDLVVHELSEEIDPPVLGERALSVGWVIGGNEDRFVGYGSGGYFELSIRDPELSSSPRSLTSHSSVTAVAANRLYLRQNDQQLEVYDLDTQRTLRVHDLSPFLPNDKDHIALIRAHDSWLYVFVSNEISTHYEVLVFELGSAGRITFSGRLYVEGDPEAYFEGALAEKQTIYVLTRTGNGGGFLDVVDLSNPYNPRLVSRTALDRPRGSPISHKGYLYQQTNDGLLAIDVSDKEAPVLRSTLANLNGVVGMVAKWNMLYVMRSVELTIVDVTRPGQPVVVASRGHSSTNSGEGLFATDQSLVSVRSESVEALPFHASQR